MSSVPLSAPPPLRYRALRPPPLHRRVRGRVGGTKQFTRQDASFRNLISTMMMQTWFLRQAPPHSDTGYKVTHLILNPQVISLFSDVCVNLAGGQDKLERDQFPENLYKGEMANFIHRLGEQLIL